MDETTTTENVNVDAQETENVQAETDWKAKYEEMRTHSREWEKLAKQNKAAAAELDALKEAQMTEAEKLNARAEKAEAELAAMKAEQAQRERIADVSKETGVPPEILAFCADSERMDDFAKAVKAFADASGATLQRVPSVAFTAGSRIVSGNEKKRSNGDIFADMFEGKL
jgi:DNA repair ATPase RecN